MALVFAIKLSLIDKLTLENGAGQDLYVRRRPLSDRAFSETPKTPAVGRFDAAQNPNSRKHKTAGLRSHRRKFQEFDPPSLK